MVALLLGLALAVGLAACGSSGGGGGGDGTATGGASTVYGATPIEPGPECPYGGVRIDYGIDENTNGVLDPEEVDGSSVVCNGAGSQANPVTPPASPAGQYTMNLTGGLSAGSTTGANGGNLELYLHGSGTGHIQLFNTGVADASFTFPAAVATYLGDSPLLVGSNLTVQAYDGATHGGMSPDEVHTHLNDYGGWIYWGDGAGTGDAGTVSGISVAEGATLTFALGYFGGTAAVSVPNDIRNEGTITTSRLGADGENSGELSLWCDTFYGAPGSLILVKGTPASTGYGGDGGYFYLTAAGSNAWGLPTGAIYNQGLIDASGADGTTDSAGSGGWVELSGALAVYNTALIDVSGGNSTSANGGQGGELHLDGYDGSNYQASIYNSGNLDTHGGNGGSYGGSGAAVSITAGGDLLNSGDILAYGGNGDAGGGGDAATSEGSFVYMEAYGGAVVNSGDILIYGGNGAGEAWGGRGAPLYISTYNDDYLYRPAGPILLSGNIDTSGGDGDYGGERADSVVLSVEADGMPASQEIQLLGYTSIDLSGGANSSNGGHAGSLLATNWVSTALGVTQSAGGVYNHVPVTARGGNAGMGANTGGNGGALELTVDPQAGYAAPWQIAANFAAVDLTGGSGFTGGDSGSVYISAPSGAQNHGNLTVNGGAAYDFGGNPGTPTERTGIILSSALGIAINTATINANGGAISDSGGGVPGIGNAVQLIGALAVHSGSLISARGGENTPVTEGNGADGGMVYLLSRQGLSTVSGDLDVAGSAGFEGDPANAGANGVILVDGINRTGDYLP